MGLMEYISYFAGILSLQEVYKLNKERQLKNANICNLLDLSVNVSAKEVFKEIEGK